MNVVVFLLHSLQLLTEIELYPVAVITFRLCGQVGESHGTDAGDGGFGYRKHKAPHLKKPAVLMAFSAVNGERFV